MANPGEKNSKWKGGVSTTPKGYLKITAGPFRDRFLHRLIWEWTHPYDAPLKENEDIHHVDGNKLNCHPSNLMRMRKDEHSNYHQENGFGEDLKTEVPF
jgi:HNH endonuclease